MSHMWGRALQTDHICSPWTYKALLHTLFSSLHISLLPCLTVNPHAPMAWKVNYMHLTHSKIHHICCCKTSAVGCRSRQSPWCVQRSDDELNAVCLCPGRDHHINIALIQCSVCCMLITATLCLTFSLSLMRSIVVSHETDGWEKTELLKADWI